jgi:hypothetical protein
MMKEYFEFRIPESHASLHLEPHVGKRLGDTVRIVDVAVNDPLFTKIGELDKQFRDRGRAFFVHSYVEHHYTRKDVETAELFHLEITSVFEPAGEECGTVYDESTACSVCGAGRKQVSDLILDLRKAPKSKGIARTIADEWIISQRLAELLVDAKMTGFELRPVRHKAHYLDDPIDLTKVPTGREILRLAKEAGFPYPTWDFYIWVNRPEQKGLAERAREEHANLLERRALHRPKTMPVWYQLIVTSATASTVTPTWFGTDPFDSENQYRCSLGHVSGLQLLSEIWIARDAWDGSDIVMTSNMIGVRRGLLIPTPLLLISPRLWRLLKTENVRGCKAEVAHLK